MSILFTNTRLSGVSPPLLEEIIVHHYTFVSDSMHVAPLYKNQKFLKNAQDMKPLRLDVLRSRSGSTLGIGSRSS